MDFPGKSPGTDYCYSVLPTLPQVDTGTFDNNSFLANCTNSEDEYPMPFPNGFHQDYSANGAQDFSGVEFKWLQDVTGIIGSGNSYTTPNIAQAPSFPFNPFNDGVLSHASFGFQDTSFGGTINGAGEVPYNAYSSSNSLNNATSLPGTISGVQRASHHINRFHPYLSTSHRSNYGTAPILAPLFSPPNILAPAASLMAPSAPTTMVLSTPASMVPFAPVSMVSSASASMVPTTPELMVPTAPASMVPTTPASMVPTTPASMVPTAPASMVPTTPASMVPTTPASMVPTAPTSMVPFIPAPAISLSIASTPEVQNEEPKGPEVITSALDFNQYCEMNGYNRSSAIYRTRENGSGQTTTAQTYFQWANTRDFLQQIVGYSGSLDLKRYKIYYNNGNGKVENLPSILLYRLSWNVGMFEATTRIFEPAEHYARNFQWDPNCSVTETNFRTTTGLMWFDKHNPYETWKGLQYLFVKPGYFINRKSPLYDMKRSDEEQVASKVSAKDIKRNMPLIIPNLIRLPQKDQ